MPDKITRADVEKVAKLARLQLSDAEVEEFTGQLGSILGYFEKLSELDTEGVEPLAHCLPISNVLREDEPKESLGVERTLANAPDTDGEFFRVPKILDDGGSS